MDWYLGKPSIASPLEIYVDNVSPLTNLILSVNFASSFLSPVIFYHFTIIRSGSFSKYTHQVDFNFHSLSLEWRKTNA